MKPTIEQLQDALRRYNEGIQYLTIYSNLSQDERDIYMGNINILYGLCCAVGYSFVEWIKKAINENYKDKYYWIDTPYKQPLKIQIQLLTRRRDKLIEIIEKYDSL